MLVLSACTDGPIVPGAAPASTRIAEVRELRDALAEPAVALGRAGTRLAAAVRALRTAPAEDPEVRPAAVAGARSQSLAALERALSSAQRLPIDGTGPDATATRDAWAEVVAAADELRSAADSELELIGRLAAVDAELEELILVWDEPGSRQQQLDAFGEAADRAEVLATELSAELQAHACTDDVQRRVDAATFVASATRELRQHVAAHRGDAFDRRRAELAQDPFGLGAPLTSAGDGDCWEEHAPTAIAVTRLTASLDAVERALNPTDLGSPDAG
ncbi:MAG TPA: hypothetical protein VGA69_11070 [Nitriliruptorales bacterium]